jgi:hypothetical protein
MNRAALFVLVFLNAAVGLAQGTYGNEWVDHDRQYWRFNIHRDGIYRIDSAALAAAGFPVTSVDPRDLMLFAREQQVPLFISGGSDGVFNAGDFIEFIGRRNDGWLDSQMFPLPSQNPNPYYSIHNDTIRYFLTWDPVAPKSRVTAYDAAGIEEEVPLPWVWGQGVRSYTDYYWQGMLDHSYWTQLNVVATSGLMVNGEGWGGPFLVSDGADGEMNAVVSLPGVYNSANAPPARVFTHSSAQNSVGFGTYDDHHLQVMYGPGFATLAFDTIFSGSQVINGRFLVPHTDINNGSGQFNLRFKVPHDLDGPGQIGSINPSYREFQTVHALKVHYARVPALEATAPIELWTPSSANDQPARLAFQATWEAPVIYAFGDSVRRVVGVNIGGQWNAMVPSNTSVDSTYLYALGQGNITSVTILSPVNGTGYFTDYSDQAADSAMLIVTHASLMDGAQQYKDYRRTNPYNRYPTVLADVNELYDQFGGGVPKHPFAIRRFANFALQTFPSDPRGLFLVGKSVNTSPRLGDPDGTRPDINGGYARCLVPTYGAPNCDQCFTIGLRFDPRRMEIPVGRLSANTVQDVLEYLAKVQATEAEQPAAWMKNIMHFGGGFTENEQTLLANYLRSYEVTATDTSFGGNVHTFLRNSSEVLEQAPAAAVEQLIEQEGVTLMTFFAHAYSSNFDITIDDPANYEWNGKHPMVIANSCYIGNIHQNGSLSASENWVGLDNAGPNAFLASVKQGVPALLHDYTSRFYRSFGQVNYGGTIGDHMRYAAFSMLSNNSNLPALFHVHTFTLQGDPLLKLNSPPEPDFVVRDQDILFVPEYVNADVDTFQVKVAITNIGRATNATMSVALDRANPNLSPPTQGYLTTASNMHFRDTVVFQVPTKAFAGGAGTNVFQARVDMDPNAIIELQESTNNVGNTAIFISSGDIIPVFPYNYAIIPDPAPVLKASTGDPLAPARTYVFQIDTTDRFNSPVRESATVTAPGGVVTWQPTSIFGLNALRDSTVFYWRCSIDSTGNQGYNWYERSFQYIPERNGWGQSHFFQFKDNTYSGILFDRPERDFDYSGGVRQIRASVSGNNPFGDTGYDIDLTAIDYSGCGPWPGWHVAVIDPVTMEPWGTHFIAGNGAEFNPQNEFGNANNLSLCRPRVQKYFTFFTNQPAQLAGMQDMIANRVPDGHHMLFYTWLYLDKDGMTVNGPGLIPAMEELGMPDLDNLPDSVPYIFYVRKGFPETFSDTVASSINELLTFSADMVLLADQGLITTVDAGPASEWQALYWDETPRNEQDSTRIILQGITPFGQVVDLFNLPSTLDSVTYLSTVAGAQQYPRLRIRGHFFDQGVAVPEPAQLKRWQLLCAPAPECAIDPGAGYLQALDGWFQGQEASVAVAVRNIGAVDMDSLLMTAWVVDRSNVRHRIHYKVNAPLPVGAVLIDTVRFNTQPFGGPNTLILEANPIDTVTGLYHQLEQYHFNNIAQWRFNVEVDRENPLVDVTFDGVHILDGDIVSSRPEIQVSLNDENTVLLLDSPSDTALFKIFLRSPDNVVKRIFFRDGTGNEVMQFVPANGPANESNILYRPNFPVDGKYQLIVQATDRSSNRSGDHDLKVNFEVVNKPTITEVLNYPNPFTTSTRFVFTVTGTEPPTNMRIQIMTVTGKVVREVKMHEIGPVRVGRNMTEFAWDGTDDFGDRLARGVYLYRVIAQLNGQDLEVRETKASEYFTKGIGKMYLLR